MFKILIKGWQPADCYLFVSYEFPFPRESHQTGKSSVVKGTNNPGFGNLIFYFKLGKMLIILFAEYPALRVSINRSPQLLRICKRAHLKLEV